MISFVMKCFVLQAFAWMTIVVIRSLVLQRARLISSQQALRVSYGIVATTVLLPILSEFYAVLTPQEVLVSPRYSSNAISSSAPDHSLLGAFALLILVLSMSFYFLLRYLRSLWHMKKFLGETIVIRRFGRVRIAVDHRHISPFSYWWLGKYWIVLPQESLENLQETRMTISHELQHIRQRDPFVAHLFQLWRILTLGSPLVAYIYKQIRVLQEFACDEYLIGHRGIQSLEYGSLLIKASQYRSQSTLSACATGMSCSDEKASLKWRIFMMTDQNFRKREPLVKKVVMLSAMLMFSATSLATSSILTDGRVTLREAESLIHEIADDVEVPLYVDEFVVDKLNTFLVSENGRKFLESSLRRMKAYAPGMKSQIDARNLPDELLAVPLVESGYQNLPENVNPVKGAGMWQFIPTTARHYGLEVSDQEDERLHVSKSTKAALDYLEKLYHQFGNWHLALIAYNMGERGLEKQILEEGTADVTQLRRSGRINDYMSKIMATILIMKKPNLVVKKDK